MDLLSFLMGVLSVLLISCAVIVGVAFRFRHLQSRLLYYPDSPEDSRSNCPTPRELGLHNSERLEVLTHDGFALRGFSVFPPDCSPHVSSVGSSTAAMRHHSPRKADYIVVYFHGNAGNVSHRIPLAALISEKLHCEVVMVDYRGYGLSDGQLPTEEGLKADGESIVHFVVHQCPSAKIVLYGTSLGAAVALDVAARPEHASQIHSVIVENTFTSISDMADILVIPLVHRRMRSAQRWVVPLFKHVLKPLVLFIGWWNITTIKSVKAPLLLLSSGRDEVVPSAQMHELRDAAVKAGTSKLVRFIEFPEGKHNDLYTKKGYVECIADFLREASLSVGGRRLADSGVV